MENLPTHPVRQAIILAGGTGSRLAPITNTIPKPMIPFHGKPFLEYLVELLKSQGIERILLLLGYLPHKVQEYFGGGKKWGMRIDYIVSPVEDETGRRLKLAEKKAEPHFLFLYCDNYVPFSLENMWAEFRNKPGARALVTVYKNTDRYTKDNLRVETDGRVSVYDKTRTTTGLQGVDIGYMITNRRVLDLLPENENISFEKTVYPKLVQEKSLYAHVTEHRYYSVGDHRRLPLTEEFLKRRPAVLIDRDGVLNRKPPRAHYVKSWSDWQWLDGAREGLAYFAQRGYRVIIISNQAGINRKEMTHEVLEKIHARMKQEIAATGGAIDAIYVCPHDWNEGCVCRKPKPGMFFAAQRDFHLDLSRTYYIGDDERDGIAARAAGAPFVSVTEKDSLLDIARRLA